MLVGRHPLASTGGQLVVSVTHITCLFMYVSVILQLIQHFPKVRSLVASIIPLLHIFALPGVKEVSYLHRLEGGDGGIAANIPN
ncbi:hypothetical protein QL285_064597 [Trifolium repens]|nr:hypothetical protein QL285_064597 [Trifolium repens]